MPTVDERLVGVRAKIERTKDHIRDLETRIHVFRQGDPYSLRSHKDPDTGHLVYRLRIRRPIPTDFSLVAGDAAHNLRSSLDHLAWQLVEAGGGTPGRPTCFPLYDAPPEREREFSRKVEGMKSGAIDLIQAMQPYQDGFQALGMLNELDNFDKHRLLYVIACGFVSLTQQYQSPLLDEIPGLRDALRGFLNDPPEPAPAAAATNGGIPLLEDGAEVIRFDWRDGPPLEMHDNLKFTYAISFARPEVVFSWAVVPLLTQLTEFVEGAVNQFVPFL